jgi:hypothetical protein
MNTSRRRKVGDFFYEIRRGFLKMRKRRKKHCVNEWRQTSTVHDQKGFSWRGGATLSVFASSTSPRAARAMRGVAAPS